MSGGLGRTPHWPTPHVAPAGHRPTLCGQTEIQHFTLNDHKTASKKLCSEVPMNKRQLDGSVRELCSPLLFSYN